MGVDDDVPMDDKAKRMRDLLSSFYSTDSSAAVQTNSSSRYATLDTINTASFDPDQYMNLLMQKANLEGLLQRHVEMAAEIKNLDTDLQMLVYENYNKFISATDTIKRMNNNIVGMESNMEQLLEKIMSVQSRSDGVNTSLFQKREHIEKLHRTRNLLRKVQFIYDLPARLGKCIKSEDYSNAVKYYTGAMPIFKAYGDSSFLDCKKASEEAIATVTKNLQGKLFLDSESIQARAEAAMLLKQLNFPVDSLKAKLLEKLVQSLDNLQLESREHGSVKNELPAQGNDPDSSPSVHEASTREFVEALRAYRVIFPDSEKQLIKLAQDLVTKHFEATQKKIEGTITPTILIEMLGFIWDDVVLIDEVLPEAAISEFSFEAARVTLKQYVDGRFSHLLCGISDAVTNVQPGSKEGVEGYSLQSALDSSKIVVTEGSIDILQNFRQLLDDNQDLLVKLRGLIIDRVQEGFQAFFRKLNDHFLLLSGRTNSPGQSNILVEGAQKDKFVSGLVLVLAQLSIVIEQSSIPRVTEEIAASFSGAGVRGYENGPAFVPVEICRMFRASSEKFLNLYISMRTQKISILLRKRFTTPNWIKHKEPREVHMFVELFLSELQEIRNEVQILPQGLHKHRRTDSNGSTTSSRSNPLRDDKVSRSNAQGGRSQLLETHLAKLFKQKMEIFTKVEHTQGSVVTTIIKLCLKSLQEFVRLQTFNRSGFQQIQLDTQFLRNALRDSTEDEAAVDFLLDEVTVLIREHTKAISYEEDSLVIVGAAERCLDPTLLEPPILDKLIQEKLAKTSKHSSSPSL